MEHAPVLSGSNDASQQVVLAAGQMQFLAFELAGEQYAVDILRVVEIRGWTPVTTVPNTPPFIKGILNLRGLIVPIIDLRQRFGLDLQTYSETTVVIVVSIHTDNGQKVVGMVVDAVSRVLNVTEGELKAPPDFGTAIHTEFIAGLATTEGDQMVMVLDLDRMLTEHEVTELNSVN